MSLERVDKLLADIKAAVKDSTPEERRLAFKKYMDETGSDMQKVDPDTLGDTIVRKEGSSRRRKSRKTRRRSRK